MEDFKIALFEKEHNSDFPFYEQLQVEACADLKSALVKKFSLKNQDFERGLFVTTIL